MKQKNNKKMMILSAIAIIIVVLGHTGCTIDLMNTIFKFGSFHMALFIFISGYFYTETNKKCMGKDGYIIKQIKKMLIPYIIWNLIYGILGMILRKFEIISFGNDINFKSFFITPWINRASIYIQFSSLVCINIVFYQNSVRYNKKNNGKVKNLARYDYDRHIFLNVTYYS